MFNLSMAEQTDVDSVSFFPYNKIYSRRAFNTRQSWIVCLESRDTSSASLDSDRRVVSALRQDHEMLVKDMKVVDDDILLICSLQLNMSCVYVSPLDSSSI